MGQKPIEGSNPSSSANASTLICFTPTAEQLPVLADDGVGFRLIRGAAGSGKTTVIDQTQPRWAVPRQGRTCWQVPTTARTGLRYLLVAPLELQSSPAAILLGCIR